VVSHWLFAAAEGVVPGSRAIFPNSGACGTISGQPGRTETATGPVDASLKTAGRRVREVGKLDLQPREKDLFWRGTRVAGNLTV